MKFEKTNLSEMLNFFNGKAVIVDADGEYPVYGSNGIIGNSKKYLYEDSIILGRVGAYCGSVERCKGKFWASDNTIVVRTKEGYDVDFAYYLLWHFPLNTFAGGAAQPLITQTILKGIDVLVPDVLTQKRIAEILSAYDDLIENNLKRIRLLEESARLLYREWFVRLKFPNHEHTPLIDGLLEGWERLAVPEFIEVNPRTPIDKDKENCFIEMANLSNDSMLVSSLQRKKGNSGSKFQKGDTLFARITPCLENGKTGFVNFLEDGEVGFGSTEFIVLRAKSVPPEFVYCLSRTYHFRENAIKNMVGSSGRQRVKTSCFDEFFVGIPPKKILDEFESITRPCFRQIRNLQLQNQKLKQARDLLLPRLMSGEIAV